MANFFFVFMKQKGKSIFLYRWLIFFPFFDVAAGIFGGQPSCWR